ncbi:MAG: STAS domain-containing protein, partial [Anaerolineales bacterium]
MEIRIETIGEATVVRLKGSFDHSVRGSMEMELLSLATYGIKLLLDLSDVDYISSTGLHLLVDLYRRCEQQNGHMALSGLSDRIREVLSLTGLTKSGISIYNTLEDGLTALGSISDTGGGSRGFSYEDAPESSYDIPKMEEKEEVNFSAFYPKEVTVEKWYTLLVYTYVPSLLDSVREDARKFKEEIG